MLVVMGKYRSSVSPASILATFPLAMWSKSSPIHIKCEVNSTTVNIKPKFHNFCHILLFLFCNCVILVAPICVSWVIPVEIETSSSIYIKSKEKKATTKLYLLTNFSVTPIPHPWDSVQFVMKCHPARPAAEITLVKDTKDLHAGKASGHLSVLLLAELSKHSAVYSIFLSLLLPCSLAASVSCSFIP